MVRRSGGQAPIASPVDTDHLGRTDERLAGCGNPDGCEVGSFVLWARGENDRLLERDRELERVGRILRRVEQGHGGAVLVEGPAGIGKTVLLAAGRDGAEAEGFRVLRARGAELEREFAFGVVCQLIEPVLARMSPEERAGLLEGPPAMAARVLGLLGRDEGGPAETPVASDPSFAVLHGLYWLCANLAAEGPMALVVDDAHWADIPSLRFLAFLLPRLEELRVAVLLGARPAEAGGSQELLTALMMDPATEVITLAPLTPDGVATLLAGGLGVEPDPQFGAACWEATGGTPFLVCALVEALREDGIAPDVASASKVQNIATANLGRWATLRLGRLGPDAARLARAVAVLEWAEPDQAARLAGLAVSDAARAADLLVRAGVLDETALGFAHPLLRAAVYRDITVPDRADAHRRASKLLAEAHASPDRLAEHLLATTPAGDGWTVDQLRAVAREAAAKGAPESAAAYLRRALTEPPSPEVRAPLLLELGLAEFSAGQPGWDNHLDEAARSPGDDRTRIRAGLVYANGLGCYQRMAEAVQVCDRAAACLDGRETESHLTLEAMAVACGLLDAAIAPSLAARLDALLVQAKQRSSPRLVLAVAAAVAAWANEPADQVAGLAHQAIEAGPQSLPEAGEEPWFRYAVTALFLAERSTEAQALLDAAVSKAQATADGMLLPAVLAQRAWLAMRRSDPTAAEADARAVLDTPGLSVAPLSRLLAAGVLVDVLVERSDLEQAERELEPLAAALHGTTVTAAFLRHARGRLLLAQRRFSGALSDFQAVGKIATRTGALSPCWLPWRSDAALAALATGQPDTARRFCNEEVKLARAFGAPRAMGVALQAAGVVAGGERGETLLREAIEVLAGPDTRLQQAGALADLGALLRRRNHRIEARHLLRQAVDAAHHLGATALATQAETELRATGAKPRRVLLSGLEALTASERRIAELAAEGLTNREIAQTLFITNRTVEGHLTNVFNKLDVESRTRLPAALATPTRAVRAQNQTVGSKNLGRSASP
jgi:DNA-binding CsgD family transcriptional regulator